MKFSLLAAPGNCQNDNFQVASDDKFVMGGTILCMHPANERWRYIVTPSLIGWAHTQNGPCMVIPSVECPVGIHM